MVTKIIISCSPTWVRWIIKHFVNVLPNDQPNFGYDLHLIRGWAWLFLSSSWCLVWNAWCWNVIMSSCHNQHHWGSLWHFPCGAECDTRGSSLQLEPGESFRFSLRSAGEWWTQRSKSYVILLGHFNHISTIMYSSGDERNPQVHTLPRTNWSKSLSLLWAAGGGFI